jgi:hypothetical protein
MRRLQVLPAVTSHNPAFWLIGFTVTMSGFIVGLLVWRAYRWATTKTHVRGVIAKIGAGMARTAVAAGDNQYGVYSVVGGYVAIADPPDGPMTVAETLGMAAWLVATADPMGTEFPTVLNGVMGLLVRADLESDPPAPSNTLNTLLVGVALEEVSRHKERYLWHRVQDVTDLVGELERRGWAMPGQRTAIATHAGLEHLKSVGLGVFI